jgi:predicted S18 family serine protease
MKWCRQLLTAVVVIALAESPAFAQGTTTSAITDTVTDSGGGVIPGATVNVTAMPE